MGQGYSTKRGGGSVYNLPTGDLPPLRFHETRGANVRILSDGFVARRYDSFCKGIVFSQRPVCIGERVILRLSGLSDQWTGVLRVGFTAVDPSTLRSLPKYACPDLTSKAGFWAKALSGQYATENALVHYHVMVNGSVIFGANGEDLGPFFSGVDTKKPLWAMVDLYGNCTTIELIDSLTSFQNLNSVQETRENLPVSIHSSTREFVPSEQTDLRQESPLRPLLFHKNVGQNVRLCPTRTVAWRYEEEFAQGYVFTADPIQAGDQISIEILSVEVSYVGSLAAGLTDVPPDRINVKNLPEDSNLLLNRQSEYWIVCKDVGNSPLAKDKLTFTLHFDGSLTMSINDGANVLLAQIDLSRTLWAFWDIYGHTSKIRALGKSSLGVPKSKPITNRVNNVATVSSINATSSSQTSECTVCYEKVADSVLYACGHICMCYECAFQQWKGRGGGFCPICRQPIKDVIKTFRS